MKLKERIYEWMVRQSRANIEATKRRNAESDHPVGADLTQKMDNRLRKHEERQS